MLYPMQGPFSGIVSGLAVSVTKLKIGLINLTF